MGRRLDYLINYPYGCLEQTASKIYAQLYLEKCVELSKEEITEVNKNIQGGLDRFDLFAHSEYGLSYWPGSNYFNAWATIFATNVMADAQTQAFNVDTDLYKNALNLIAKSVNDWQPIRPNSSLTPVDSYAQQRDQLTQSYALYVLALAKKESVTAMNRLKNIDNLYPLAKLRLAAAYALIGQQQIAQSLMQEVNQISYTQQTELSYTFGSALRDKAFALECYTLLDNEEKATKLARTIANTLNEGGWQNTQAIAYAFKAISLYLQKYNSAEELKFALSSTKDGAIQYGSNNAILKVDLSDNNGEVQLKNESSGTLYVKTTFSGKSQNLQQAAAKSNLEMKVEYTNLKGNPIQLNTLTQGQEILAKVTVWNPSPMENGPLKELALEQTFPAGWEIINTRMDNIGLNFTQSPFTYQDFRDDAVYTFFNLLDNKPKTFYVKLLASYEGDFYFPPTQCKAMYNNEIFNRAASQEIRIQRDQYN